MCWQVAACVLAAVWVGVDTAADTPIRLSSYWPFIQFFPAAAVKHARAPWNDRSPIALINVLWRVESFGSKYFSHLETFLGSRLPGCGTIQGSGLCACTSTLLGAGKRFLTEDKSAWCSLSVWQKQESSIRKVFTQQTLKLKRTSSTFWCLASINTARVKKHLTADHLCSESIQTDDVYLPTDNWKLLNYFFFIPLRWNYTFPPT